MASHNMVELEGNATGAQSTSVYPERPEDLEGLPPYIENESSEANEVEGKPTEQEQCPDLH